MKKTKKKVKVRDMKPKKDTKAGGLHGHHYIQRPGGGGHINR
jgi:hypothetical protein